MAANATERGTNRSASGQPNPRLERMLQFLDRDPTNLGLLADAAAAAYDARDFDLAADLIKRHAAIGPLPSTLANLQALVAIAQQRFTDAAAILGDLRGQGHDDPALRFNLAWARAMTGAHREALDLLDDDTVAASPRAPALKILMMHHLGLYEDALACGKDLAERYPDNQALMGALATLALDAEETDLALSYAQRAGDNPEGCAALGTLALGDHDIGRSLELFEQALSAQPQNPRAWVGKGLALLASGDAPAATKAIDRGAELFEDHLGSWIASGWAHFVSGDYAGAQARFERALALDPNFAESHGGLAVVDIVEGKLDDARKKSDVALRLDKNCFGGALAKSMLLEHSGHAQAAQKIRDAALATPIGAKGQTIAQALIGFGSLGDRRGPRKPKPLS